MKKTLKVWRNLMLVTLCLAFNFHLLAQNAIDVSGVVSGSDGTPLPGVSVVQKSTTNGTITDIDGRYSLSLSSNATLVFSFVGMETLEVEVEGKSTINVTMEVSSIAMDEVVVVGYGTQRKSDLTGSVGSVSADQLREIPITRLDEGLQGKIAGVSIQNTDGSPGGGTKVRIRGSSSINFSNDPIYVIDGFIGADISTINPKDIESIVVLKDASATAIYGSRGANGVVIITSKSASLGCNGIIMVNSNFSTHVPILADRIIKTNITIDSVFIVIIGVCFKLPVRIVLKNCVPV